MILASTNGAKYEIHLGERNMVLFVAKRTRSGNYRFESAHRVDQAADRIESVLKMLGIEDKRYLALQLIEESDRATSAAALRD